MIGDRGQARSSNQTRVSTAHPPARMRARSDVVRVVLDWSQSRPSRRRSSRAPIPPDSTRCSAKAPANRTPLSTAPPPVKPAVPPQPIVQSTSASCTPAQSNSKPKRRPARSQPRSSKLDACVRFALACIYPSLFSLSRSHLNFLLSPPMHESISPADKLGRKTANKPNTPP